ncbi:hypothetical protein [Notoacmeibacter marinus]|uniref:hypothetical protein n=1 Tax=Notoacmeibacter marinus TaxID=1876515 RepID=UPI0013030EC6|nr:hypothetical protein [Notoacmeibacter marinus]
MDFAALVDKALIPLGAGVGTYLATRLSPNLRRQSTKANAVLVIIAIIVIAGLQWFGVI